MAFKLRSQIVSKLICHFYWFKVTSGGGELGRFSLKCSFDVKFRPILRSTKYGMNSVTECSLLNEFLTFTVPLIFGGIASYAFV